MNPSRLALGTTPLNVLRQLCLQEMLAGLCESYGSVISLAVYVGILAGDEDADTRIASSVAAIKSEFDRCSCHSNAARPLTRSADQMWWCDIVCTTALPANRPRSILAQNCVCRLEAAGACQLEILVVSERLQDQVCTCLRFTVGVSCESGPVSNYQCRCQTRPHLGCTLTGKSAALLSVHGTAALCAGGGAPVPHQRAAQPGAAECAHGAGHAGGPGPAGRRRPESPRQRPAAVSHLKIDTSPWHGLVHA